MIIFLNNGTKPIRIVTSTASGTWRDLLDVVGHIPVRDDTMRVTLPARSGAIMARY